MTVKRLFALLCILSVSGAVTAERVEVDMLRNGDWAGGVEQSPH